MRNKSFFVLMLGFCLLMPQLFAQKTQAEKKQLQTVLNAYVEYVNMNIHALRFYQKRMGELNKTMNRYIIVAPTDKKERMAFEGGRDGIIILYETPTILQDDSVFSILPEDLFQKTLQTSSILPEDARLELNSKMRQVHDIVEELDKNSKLLYSYFSTAKHWDQPNLDLAFAALNRCEVLFHDFAESKNALYFTLQKVFAAQMGVEPITPYTRSAKKLQVMALYARSILESMKKQDREAIEDMMPQLKTALADIRENEKKYLEGAKNPTTNEATDPSLRYKAVVHKGEIFLKLVEEYLHNPDVDGRYASFGTEYYYYNVLLLNNYNHYGSGIADEYNLFVETADVPMLKMTEEPHWLKYLGQAKKIVLEQEPEPVDTVKKEPEIVVVQPEKPKTPTKPVEISPYPKNPTPTPKPKPVAKVEEPKVVEAPKEPTPLDDAAPNNLVFLLDVSGSMMGPSKFPLLKSSFKNLLALLRPEDNIAIVTYSGGAKVILNSTPCSKKKEIMDAIDHLQSGGKSDVIKGLKTAFKTAESHLLKDGNNRVILATDGTFKIDDEVKQAIQNGSDGGVKMTVFYFEEKEYPVVAKKLQELAVIGGGNYSYLNGANANEKLLEEAKAVAKKNK